MVTFAPRASTWRRRALERPVGGSDMTTRILYVDDDPDTCVLVGDLLRAHGFDVVAETSSVRGVELGRDPTYGVVVTDLRMHGLDGLALCKQLVASRPGLPVIVVTGDATLAAAVGALRA